MVQVNKFGAQWCKWRSCSAPALDPQIKFLTIADCATVVLRVSLAFVGSLNEKLVIRKLKSGYITNY